MLARIVVAILIGVVTWLICVFGGALLVALNVPVLETLGKLLQSYAIIIGAIGGLLAFFTGWRPF